MEQRLLEQTPNDNDNLPGGTTLKDAPYAMCVLAIEAVLIVSVPRDYEQMRLGPNPTEQVRGYVAAMFADIEDRNGIFEARGNPVQMIPRPDYLYAPQVAAHYKTAVQVWPTRSECMMNPAHLRQYLMDMWGDISELVWNLEQVSETPLVHLKLRLLNTFAEKWVRDVLREMGVRID